MALGIGKTANFRLSWRPSGGRGEYEYSCPQFHAENKSLTVLVPQLSVAIDSSVTCRLMHGKHRLRRDNPNDRKSLNLPNLVVALACLPDPIREDKTGTLKLPLTEHKYVIDIIDFEVVEKSTSKLLIYPIAMRARHDTQFIRLDLRIEKLLHELRDPNSPKRLTALLQSHFSNIKMGVNGVFLRDSARDVINAMSKITGDASGFMAGEVRAAEMIAKSSSADEIIGSYKGKEGRIRIVTHARKERDQKIVKIAKNNFLTQHGKLFCECCGFDFESSYSKYGKGYIEAHHTIPISDILPDTETDPSDLSMVCANCHRVIHRGKNILAISDVRDILEKNSSIINEGNLNLL